MTSWDSVVRYLLQGRRIPVTRREYRHDANYIKKRSIKPYYGGLSRLSRMIVYPQLPIPQREEVWEN